MSAVPVWAYRFTAENREHVVTFAEHPLHWEDAPIVLNTYRLDRFDAKDIGAVIADALNVREATGLTPSQLQARVAELEAALRPALEFVELFSNRWDGRHGRHPFGIVTDARKALGVEG